MNAWSILTHISSRSWPKSSHFSVLWLPGVFLYSTTSCHVCSKTPYTRWLQYNSHVAEISFVYSETGEWQLHVSKPKIRVWQSHFNRKKGAQVRAQNCASPEHSFPPKHLFPYPGSSIRRNLSWVSQWEGIWECMCNTLTCPTSGLALSISFC